jgi:hypothetical protein
VTSGVEPVFSQEVVRMRKLCGLTAELSLWLKNQMLSIP